ncbi:MAG: 50S ribosomal protein L21 [Longimicrobiales bacterium]
MYAIFRTGDKQFRAEPGQTVRVPSLDADVGDTVTLEDVLVASGDDGVNVGAPTVAGASVKAEVIGHGRGEKIIVFKWKRRKNYRRKQGHRQGYTEIRIEEISLGKKKGRKKKAESAEEE